jgi:DNA-binding NtrC family response regulator
MPDTGTSVLLVDSRPAGLRLMQGVLRRYAEVTWTPGLAEALALLERRRFDALVASIELLDADEHEAGERFMARAGALCSGLGRVLVGPEERADDLLGALRQGEATAFVLEPFTPDELLVAVRRALRTEPPRALLVLSDREVRLRIKGLLERSGVECWEGEDARQVIPRLESRALDGVVVGLDLGAAEALALLGHLRSHMPWVRPVVVGPDDLPALAADLRRLGVYDYLSPAVSDEQLVFRVRAALEDSPWADAAVVASEDTEELVGSSRPVDALRAVVATVAGSAAPALIRGETGVGKKLVARRIHALGPRRAGPFFAVDCAALTETLFDSEVFGHEPGAFPGATTSKPGLCELAAEGTLFLDELAEVSPALQGKLARLLQTGELVRLGGRTVVHSKVRVLAATSRSPAAVVAEGSGEIRVDLLVLLAGLEVQVPPLRERIDDLPQLVAHLLARLCQEHGRPPTRLAPRAFERLLVHHWPGNVRELGSALERALLLATGTVIQEVRLGGGDGAIQQPLTQGVNVDQPLREAVETATRQVEFDYLVRVLTLAGGNVIQASRRSGIDRRNFYRKLTEHGLDPAQFRRTTGSFSVVR